MMVPNYHYLERVFEMLPPAGNGQFQLVPLCRAREEGNYNKCLFHFFAVLLINAFSRNRLQLSYTSFLGL